MSDANTDHQRMEKIVSLCKRRGFIFQSSEIYGGLNGSWDYGPLGVELKRNLKDYWWRRMVHERDDIVGMDGSILMNRAVWKASGHEDTFTDPMVDCLVTKKRFRADQIEPQPPALSMPGPELQSVTRMQKGGQLFRRYRCFRCSSSGWETSRKRKKSAPLNYYKQRGFSEPESVGEVTEKVENTTRYNPENGALLDRAAVVQPDVQDIRRRDGR